MSLSLFLLSKVGFKQASMQTRTSEAAARVKKRYYYLIKPDTVL